MSGGDETGWAPGASEYAFQGASNVADTNGISNLIPVKTAPFNLTTFAPARVLVNAGAGVPRSAAGLPVRFQYGPSAIPVIRKQALTIGAME
jgi:hypothetical protein